MYVPEDDKAALRALDVRQLETLLEEAMWLQRATGLYSLRLSSCGPYVAQRLRRFERDLGEYAKAKAKAAKKRSETLDRATHAKSELIHAVREMQDRVEREERETQLLRLDDVISPPSHFRDRIDVYVHYQWRDSVENDWAYGTITFVHDVDMSPDYTRPIATPKREPSAAKQEEARQETLYRHWEHLKGLALHAVREYLLSGADKSAIPRTFQAKPDRHGRYLNNFSCDFWKI